MTLKTVRPGAVIAACVLLAMAGTAGAQTTANITIDGTFVPPTCAVTIAGGGALDWGTMTRGTVLGYVTYFGAKELPVKTVKLEVSCPNETVVGLNWLDNRASTKLSLDTSDPFRFGLTNGHLPSQVLGAYDVWATSLTATAAPVPDKFFLQQASGGTWLTASPVPGGASYTHYAHPGYVSAFGRTATSATTPIPLKDFSFNLNVKPFVSTAIVTASTSSILIDGSATVTLKYF